VTRAEYLPLTPSVVDLEWRVAAVVDVDGDQTPDIVWHHDTAGWVAVWFMNGTLRTGVSSFPIAIDTNWKVAGPR
jgi:hypothetical protein